mmetsp:Transcript_32594/g.85927  ORF Transcript_32594/g.85927 Transcript_32594/m.85927 type:complete len:210 (-) Transcript_32594:3578-4207(-)
MPGGIPPIPAWNSKRETGSETGAGAGRGQYIVAASLDTHHRIRARGARLLRKVSDHGLRGHHEAGDRAGIHDSRAHDLSRIDDTCVHHVYVLAGLGVVAELRVVRLQELAADHGALGAGVARDGHDWRPDGPLNDLDADPLVHVLRLGRHILQVLRRPEQRLAPTRHDALLDGRSGGVQRVHNPILLLPHLRLRRPTDLNHSDAARKLR